MVVVSTGGDAWHHGYRENIGMLHGGGVCNLERVAIPFYATVRR